MLIATDPGLGADAHDFTASAAIVLVVIAPEPAAFIDAYALLKAMSLENGRHVFWVVTNLVADKTEGRRLFDQLAAAV